MCSGADGGGTNGNGNGGVCYGLTPGSKRTRAAMDALEVDLEELAARRKGAAAGGDSAAAGGAWRGEVLAGWREQRGQFRRVKGGSAAGRLGLLTFTH
jgi:hypothetical protein